MHFKTHNFKKFKIIFRNYYFSNFISIIIIYIRNRYEFLYWYIKILDVGIGQKRI